MHFFGLLGTFTFGIGFAVILYLLIGAFAAGSDYGLPKDRVLYCPDHDGDGYAVLSRRLPGRADCPCCAGPESLPGGAAARVMILFCWLNVPALKCFHSSRRTYCISFCNHPLSFSDQCCPLLFFCFARRKVSKRRGDFLLPPRRDSAGKKIAPRCLRGATCTGDRCYFIPASGCMK